MIIDTSALAAIMFDERDARDYADAMAHSHVNRMSAATFLEAGIVVDSRRDPVASAQLDELLANNSIIIEPITEKQAALARQAYRDYGRGSGHAAALNFGDCFSYALAKDLGETLLFKGEDFGLTDIRSALG